jgi:hypothetical protein
VTTSDDDPVVFFLDENSLGRHIAGRLRNAGANIREPAEDTIPRGTPDATLLLELGSRGWFLITRDTRMRSRPAEVAARRAAGVGVFILRGRRLNGEQVATALVSALHAMERKARKQQRPFVCHVNAEGKVSLVEGEGRLGARRK